MLPSRLVVYYALALALFMDMGGGRVMRKLAGTEYEEQMCLTSA